MRTVISGIHTWEEAWNAVKRGIHALGFVLEPQSPRYIDPEKAREIIKELPPFINTVGVFQNTPRYVIQELTTFCRLDWLLFLGEEKPKECEDYFQPVIKAVSSFTEVKKYTSVNSFLIMGKENNDKSLLETLPPYIIYPGTNLGDNIPEAYGLYFLLDGQGRVNGEHL